MNFIVVAGVVLLAHILSWIVDALRGVRGDGTEYVVRMYVYLAAFSVAMAFIPAVFQ